MTVSVGLHCSFLIYPFKWDKAGKILQISMYPHGNIMEVFPPIASSDRGIFFDTDTGSEYVIEGLVIFIWCT